MLNPKEKTIRFAVSAVFQFSLLGVLTWCLYKGIGDSNTIIGAVIGLAVGIGINSIVE